MSRALASYLRDEVWLRRRELVADSQFWLGILLGAAVVLFRTELGLEDVTLGGIVPGVLAYAAIVFGFALAGLTIAVTLPDDNFTDTLLFFELPADGRSGFLGSGRRARERMHRRSVPPNAYHDLLFVFSWTAVVHWATIVLTLATIIACGPDRAALPDQLGLVEGGGLIAYVALLSYGVMQFLVAVLTLSGLGTTYVQRRRSEGRRSKD